MNNYIYILRKEQPANILVVWCVQIFFILKVQQTVKLKVYWIIYCELYHNINITVDQWVLC